MFGRPGGGEAFPRSQPCLPVTGVVSLPRRAPVLTSASARSGHRSPAKLAGLVAAPPTLPSLGVFRTRQLSSGDQPVTHHTHRWVGAVTSLPGQEGWLPVLPFRKPRQRPGCSPTPPREPRQGLRGASARTCLPHIPWLVYLFGWPGPREQGQAWVWRRRPRGCANR